MESDVLKATRAEYRIALNEAMDEKMQIGRERYGDAWTECDPDYLLRRAEEEFYELRQATEHDWDYDAAVRELADFANFALMYIAASRHAEADDGE